MIFETIVHNSEFNFCRLLTMLTNRLLTCIKSVVFIDNSTESISELSDDATLDIFNQEKIYRLINSFMLLTYTYFDIIDFVLSVMLKFPLIRFPDVAFNTFLLVDNAPL